jgi:hypothetical protein
MASHFACIGLPFDTQDNFMEHVQHAIAVAPSLTGSMDETLADWTDPSGAGLDVTMVDRAEGDGLVIRCATPTFSGSTSLALTVGHVAEHECRWCDVLVGFLPGDEMPIPMQVDDLAIRRPELTAGATVEGSVAFFVEQVQSYVDEAAYYAAQTAAHPFAAEHYVPSGMFGDPPAAAKAVAGGVVRSAEWRRNEATGIAFGHATMATLPGIVDVVWAPSDLDRLPPPGGVLAGSFWCLFTLR